MNTRKQLREHQQEEVTIATPSNPLSVFTRALHRKGRRGLDVCFSFIAHATYLSFWSEEAFSSAYPLTDDLSRVSPRNIVAEITAV